MLLMIYIIQIYVLNDLFQHVKYSSLVYGLKVLYLLF